MRTAIVCGGRDYRDHKRVAEVLRKAVYEWRIQRIADGWAPGADTAAHLWAKSRGINTVRFPAGWIAHGKAAGAIRNQEMLEATRPVVVVAFPGGTGTADMVRRARAAGVPVVEVEP